MLTFDETLGIVKEIRRLKNIGLKGFFSNNTEKKVAVVHSIYTLADMFFSEEFMRKDDEVQMFSSVAFALGYILSLFENAKITELSDDTYFHLGKFLNILIDFISYKGEAVERALGDDVCRH